ncbi:hypothetical protein ACHAXT_011571 [Thalassiosira profunda]
MSAPSTTAASRPGAMSLLDKYAQINASIDDARRRVADARAALEQKQSHSARLRDEREGMLAETEAANAEKAKLETDLKAAKDTFKAKATEREGVERAHRLAKKQHAAMRARIDDERNAFLERGREFRASCKRTRVAASLLVLDGGCGPFDAKDNAADDSELWRRLQEEDFSDDEGEEGATTRKRPDPEMEQVEREEKEAREDLIEAECALDSIRKQNADAIKRSNDRSSKLTQQRAQLTRHRKEVEELEREIQGVKDDIVEQNQLANAFEKNVHQRKQREANASAARNSGSYASSFNPPHEARSGTSRGSHNPYSNYRTPQTTGTNGGNQQRPRAVTNPYNKQNTSTSRTPIAYRQSRSAPTPPRASNRGQNSSATNNASQQYGSDAYGSGQEQRNVSRSKNFRNQRQFGTSVGVSLDDGMTDELRECMSSFAPAESASATTGSGRKAAAAADDVSMSSASSDSDDDLLSFNIFSKK